MTYTTQYPDWLAQLSSIGLRIDLPPLRIGVAYNITLDIAAHETLGDWTGGAVSMMAKMSPGAATAIVTFTVTVGTPSGGVTPFTVDASVADQVDIPDPDETGVSVLYYDILYTPTGFSPELVCGGVLPIIAGVTE